MVALDGQDTKEGDMVDFRSCNDSGTANMMVACIGPCIKGMFLIWQCFGFRCRICMGIRVFEYEAGQSRD